MRGDRVTYAAIGMGILCSLYFHGYEIFNFTLSIDEELLQGSNEALAHIGQGRWGIALRYWLLIPDATLPITPIATGLALYAIAFTLLIGKFKIQHWQSVVVAAPFFFGFPVLVYDLAFSGVAINNGIAALVTVAAVYASDRFSIARFILAALLISIAISLYQSFLFFAIVLFIANFARNYWPFNGDLRRSQLVAGASWYGLIVIAAVFCYSIIELVFLWVAGQPIEHIGEFYRPDFLIAHPSTVVARTLYESLSIYSGISPIFLGNSLYYQVILGAFMLTTIYNIYYSYNSRKEVIPLLVCAVAMFATPFIQYPVSQGYMPYRTLVAVPAVITIISLSAAELSTPFVRKYLLLPLALLVMIEFSWISNKQYYGGHWALERDKTLATQIISRITDVVPNQKVYTIAVVGAPARKHSLLIPDIATSTLGASFFEWDGGNVNRIAAFLNIVSDAEFRAATPKQSLRAIEKSATMPTWPAKGSVADRGDAVVIKFSDATEGQLQLLCRRQITGLCASHR